jgi:hypothetical protein
MAARPGRRHAGSRKVENKSLLTFSLHNGEEDLNVKFHFPNAGEY